MTTDGAELEKLMNAEQIKTLAKRAGEHFAKNINSNIFEEDKDSLKIVKLFDKDSNPVYFLISQKLGAGAFGEVSRGIQLNIEQGTIIPDTDAAIKITDFTEGGTLSRLDIPSAKQLTEHENNVLKVIQQSYGYSVGERRKKIEYDLGEGIKVVKEANVQEAIVAMPLHPGKDIQHKAHKDKFSYGSITFIELATKLCDDLDNLHKNGIIHTDLKPANVIWDAQNSTVNIVDFNRAKFLPEGEDMISDDASSDKAYMAPECFTKQGYQYSKAADVYAVGKILLEKYYITHPQTEETKTLHSKKYLSYDQLLIKPFLDKMTSPDPTQRPTLKQCTDFFKQLENKMKLDIDPNLANNKLRLELSKKIINLEVYANQLQKEIQKQNVMDSLLVSTGIIADKSKRYDAAIKTIGLLTQALSTPEINTKLLKEGTELLQKESASSSGYLSFKGRYNEIIRDTLNKVQEQEKENGSDLNVKP